MASDIGGFFGGLIAAFLIVGALRWLLRRFGAGSLVVVIGAPAIFLAIATIAGGFGFAAGGDAVFAQAFLTYLAPAVVAGLVYALVDRGRASARGKTS